MNKIKVCSKCGIEKELNTDNFCKHRGRKDGFDTECKECKRIRDAERYARERSSISEQKKKYYQKNKDAIKERQIKYYSENTELCRKRERRWRLNNPNARRVINERRRTRELELPSTLTSEQWGDIKAAFNHSCAYCGMSEKEHLKINGELLHQEHFIPLLKGGAHEKKNIIPSCRSCNSSKANKDFDEWYPKQEYYNEDRKIKILSHLNSLQKKVII